MTLLLDDDYVELFTQGHISIPALSTSFPAQRISTDLEWEDLVLNNNILKPKPIKKETSKQSNLATIEEQWRAHRKKLLAEID